MDTTHLKAWTCLAVCLAAAPAAAAPLTDAQVRQRIIRESIAAYPGRGACPYSRLSNGQTAGSRSVYSRPGGHSPKCYPRDVSAAEVRAWREANR